jgi:hypothetical protein
MPTDAIEQRKLAAIMFTDMVGYSALSLAKPASAGGVEGELLAGAISMMVWINELHPPTTLLV